METSDLGRARDAGSTSIGPPVALREVQRRRRAAVERGGAGGKEGGVLEKAFSVHSYRFRRVPVSAVERGQSRLVTTIVNVEQGSLPTQSPVAGLGPPLGYRPLLQLPFRASPGPYDGAYGFHALHVQLI
ncbi:hypothetical protein NL676_021320 [Syzygium grande]|nr:hypothetical protein NL676_021320 [Syzygium grande]